MTYIQPSSFFSSANGIDEMLNVPEIVFVVPYRDREQHKTFFTRYMKDYILQVVKKRWQILYIHQCDKRQFNRGAMKNLGFIYLKEKYPNHYKEITIVFNDVDTVPYKQGLLNYDTTSGTIKHFFGFTFALGGIASIKAGDFEMINGFPNLWGWGFEDNELQIRVKEMFSADAIDRRNFYAYTDPNILTIFHGFYKEVSNKQKEEYGNVALRRRPRNAKYWNGLNTIRDYKYNTNELEDGVIMVNVASFQTMHDDKRYNDMATIDSSKTQIRISSKPKPMMPMLVGRR
jgi:hypothetical protein